MLSSLGVQVVTEQPFRLVRSDAQGAPGGAFIFDFGAARRPGRRASAGSAGCGSRRSSPAGRAGPRPTGSTDWSPRRAWTGSGSRCCGPMPATCARPGRHSARRTSRTRRWPTPRSPACWSSCSMRASTPTWWPTEPCAPTSCARQITRALDDVASLDQDRILRSFLDLIRATLRTNHFQADRPAAGDQARAGAHPRAPRAAAEVRDLGLLAAGRGRAPAVRQGGPRRPALVGPPGGLPHRGPGLVKAQAVKNAVIVPVGAKGGFFAKQLPDPALDRDAWMAEGIGAYKVFVGSLLDLTDNLVGQRRRPAGARRAPRR